MYISGSNSLCVVRTSMYISGETRIWQVKNEVTRKLVFCTGVQIQHMRPVAAEVEAHAQLVTNILQRKYNTVLYIYIVEYFIAMG